MNDAELYKELSLNKSDETLARAELKAAHDKWVKYVMENKDVICSNYHPMTVKKKKSAIWREFICKIKSIFGFTPKIETCNYATETHL